MNDKFFSKFLKEWVAGSRNIDAGGIMASRMARLQMQVLVESSHITKEDGLLGRKESTLVLPNGLLTDAETGGVTQNITLQVTWKTRGTR